MKRYRKRKCKHCHEFFLPDPRNHYHQRYCSKPDCRRASKVASQHRWLSKPGNRSYFRGPANVERVRAWRKANPGYRKRKETQGPSALQDLYPSQVADNPSDSDDLEHSPLQDLLASQAIVLIGLIAQLTDSTLQEDIAQCGRRLLHLGQDILSGARSASRGGRHAKTSIDSITSAPGPAPV